MQIKKGILLVFILGVISILALIVLAVLTLTSTAQKILSLYTYQTKSQFASFSGLQFAYATMRYNVEKNPIVSVTDPFYFKGEVNNVETWDFTDINNNGFPDTVAIDVYNALNPSFASKIEFYSKNKEQVYFSGIVDESYEFISVYKLKIIDLSSLIYIAHISQGGKNILNNLSKILHYPVFLGDVLSSIYLEKGKISSFDSIKDILSFTNMDVLANFITLDGWRYPELIYANNSPEDNKTIQSGYQYLQDSLKKISIENRAPLNINLIPPTLIKANLYSLSANVLLDKPDYNIDIPQNISLDEAIKVLSSPTELIKYAIKVKSKKFPKLGYTKNYEIDKNKIDKLTELILKQRIIKPFDSYDAFYNFMLSSSKETGLSKIDIDIIDATINPSFNLQKFNLDKIMKKEVDKTDIVNQTVEFIFFTPGEFVLESAGYLFNKKSGELLAKDVVKARFNAFNIVTLNKYEDFSRGEVNVNEFAKLYRGVLPGPFYAGYRKNSLNRIEKFPGFIHLGLVLNKITTDDITFCDAFEFPKPIVGQSDDNDFTIFNDGVYSSGEMPFKLPITDNFPVIDFQTLFGIPYKCEMFKGTMLETACGKISRGTFCFWLKPNYKVVDSSRIRTLISIQSEDSRPERVGDINYMDSFIVSFVPLNFVKNMVAQYFPLFAPHTKFTLATPFFLWTPKINPAYLSLVESDSEVIKDGEWTHICIQWDSVKTVERNLATKIFINGENKTFLFGGDYSLDFTRMFQYFAPQFSNAKYIVFGADKDQKYWNFPLEATLDNIVISKRLYTVEEITNLFYKEGRYVKEDAFWQSREINLGVSQRPLFASVTYLPSEKVKLEISLIAKKENRKMLLPITLFDNPESVLTAKLRIYFNVLNNNIPLLETPIVADSHLFFSPPTSTLNILASDVLLDVTLYQKK